MIRQVCITSCKLKFDTVVRFFQLSVTGSGLLSRRFECGVQLLRSIFIFYYVHITSSKRIRKDNGTETRTNVTTNESGAAPRRSSDGGALMTLPT